MDIKSILAKFKFQNSKASGLKMKSLNPGTVFSGLAIVMVVLDLWLLQSAVVMVFRSRSSDVGAKAVQSIRVDFPGYNKAVDRIDGASTYTPAIQLKTNPFQALKKEQQKTPL